VASNTYLNMKCLRLKNQIYFFSIRRPFFDRIKKLILSFKISLSYQISRLQTGLKRWEFWKMPIDIAYIQKIEAF
jgi:hypothetical protein